MQDQSHQACHADSEEVSAGAEQHEDAAQPEVSSLPEAQEVLQPSRRIMGLLQDASTRWRAAQQLRQGSRREPTQRGFSLAMPPLPPTPGGHCSPLSAGTRCPSLPLCYLRMSAGSAAVQLPI